MNKPKVIAIHHVAIQTDDIERALHFYVDILGAEVIKRNKFKKRQMAWLRVGAMTIELFSKRDGDQLSVWHDRQAGPIHIAFAVEDLDIFLESALSKGAQFHSSKPEPFIPPVPGAQKIAYLSGPDGEEVEIRNLSDNS
jgi:glyoxylase I family protein